ncbi:DUF2726 domain-containing protein [Jannaschia sp. W003]|uniref:DUF2726 domain-containing protein n=1 Tax=Jannaschia sp. W003 TaxID=2867012 RepID=UPI0021A3AA38|nr:DUF2726 domain-containing protein [Jannaschia sp. W003]UWQ20943.1 DUF2726 domain-containing protein [Jannaschia sp. W003]
MDFASLLGAVPPPALAVVAVATLVMFLRARGLRTARPRPTDVPEALADCTIRAVNRLMSAEQAACFAAVRRWAEPRGLHVCAEVSLSALFTVDHADRRRRASGFGSLRQKYLDLLVIDAACRPLVGIEYHGSGHFGARAKRSDAIKRHAFAAAGLQLLEVDRNVGAAELARRLDAAVPQAPDEGRRAA